MAATTHRVASALHFERGAELSLPDLTYTVRPSTDPPGTLVCVAGEVDLATASDLQRTLEAIVTIEEQALIVDLGAVEFFDCAGLRVLTELQPAMAAKGGHLSVVNARPLVAQLLALGQLDHLLLAA